LAIAPAQIPSNAFPAQVIANLETSAPKQAQVLQATVVGGGEGGATKVSISNQLLGLIIPGKLPSGTLVQLLIRGTGPNAQITALPQTVEPVTRGATPQGSVSQGSVPQGASQASVPVRVVQGQSPVQRVQQQNTQTQSAPPLARSPAGVGTLGPKQGQVLQARVVAGGEGGITRVSVNNQILSLVFPGKPQTGSFVQLQIQGSVPNAQITVLPQNVTSTPQGAVTDGKVAQGASATETSVQKAGTQAASQALSQAPAVPIQNTVQLALTQTAQSAVGRQDSLGVLIANLVNLGGKADSLPQPVAQAASQLLVGRLSLNGRSLDGQSLKTALARSGIFLENALGKGSTPGSLQGDLKAALLGIRSALAQWLGEDAPELSRSHNRPPPPAKGDIPRSITGRPQSVSDAMPTRELGKIMQGQAESALARMRLAQIASLPQETAAGRAAQASTATDLSLEIPLTLGSETSMAQFRISRDGEEGGSDQERGWQLQFSMAFGAIGEVGAQVILRSKRVGVNIWTEREEIAETLQAALPDLAEAMEAHGLKPGGIRVRHGVPASQPKTPGIFMDERS